MWIDFFIAHVYMFVVTETSSIVHDIGLIRICVLWLSANKVLQKAHLYLFKQENKTSIF